MPPKSSSSQPIDVHKTCDGCHCVPRHVHVDTQEVSFPQLSFTWENTLSKRVATESRPSSDSRNPITHGNLCDQANEIKALHSTAAAVASMVCMQAKDAPSLPPFPAKVVHDRRRVEQVLKHEQPAFRFSAINLFLLFRVNISR